jgi:hypothetical protein
MLMNGFASDFARLTASEEAPTHCSPSSSYDQAPSRHVRPVLADDDDEDNLRTIAAPLSLSRPPQPSFAALSALPHVHDHLDRQEDKPTRLERSPVPTALAAISYEFVESEPDEIVHRPVPARLEMTMRSSGRDPSTASSPRSVAPHGRTEPVGYPLMTPPSIAPSGSPVSPTGPTALAAPHMRIQAITGSSLPRPSSHRVYQDVGGTVRSPEQGSSPSNAPAPAPRASSGAWTESPWVVSSSPSSPQFQPIATPDDAFKLELPMVAAIAMGMLAFCLLVGAFLFVRSDNASMDEAATAAHGASDTPVGPAALEAPAVAPPTLPMAFAVPVAATPQPRVIAVPAPVRPVVSAAPRTTVSEDGTPAPAPRKTRKAERASERAADAESSATTASSASSSSSKPTSNTSKKKSGDKGKSLEQILDELGEEQLRR